MTKKYGFNYGNQWGEPVWFDTREEAVEFAHDCGWTIYDYGTEEYRKLTEDDVEETDIDESIKTYVVRCDGIEEEIEAENPQEAIEEYMGDCWPPEDETYYVNLTVNGEWHRITIHPEEPSCNKKKHDWEQESVWGHGGGVIITDKCRHCGLKKVLDTWAMDRENGEQGLESIRYEKEQT